MSRNSILLVDDEKGIRQSLGTVLAEEGFKVTTAKNGEECLQVLENKSFELILLDVWLPGINGLETLERIKEMKVSAAVVMISGHGTIETAVKATRLGAFDFIEKPLSIEKLVESAKKALSAFEKNLEEDIALILKNNCSSYKKTFVALDAEIGSDKFLFLNGEVGTEKEVFAKYIHSQKYKREDNFVNFQLDLLATDPIDNELIFRLSEQFVVH